MPLCCGMPMEQLVRQNTDEVPRMPFCCTAAFEYSSALRLTLVCGTAAQLTAFGIRQHASKGALFAGALRGAFEFSQVFVCLWSVAWLCR
jgi:hypothetical protein